jgi:hypothetical protein
VSPSGDATVTVLAASPTIPGLRRSQRLHHHWGERLLRFSADRKGTAIRYQQNEDKSVSRRFAARPLDQQVNRPSPVPEIRAAMA